MSENGALELTAYQELSCKRVNKPSAFGGSILKSNQMRTESCRTLHRMDDEECYGDTMSNLQEGLFSSHATSVNRSKVVNSTEKRWHGTLKNEQIQQSTFHSSKPGPVVLHLPKQPPRLNFVAGFPSSQASLPIPSKVQTGSTCSRPSSDGGNRLEKATIDNVTSQTVSSSSAPDRAAKSNQPAHSTAVKSKPSSHCADQTKHGPSRSRKDASRAKRSISPLFSDSDVSRKRHRGDHPASSSRSRVEEESCRVQDQKPLTLPAEKKNKQSHAPKELPLIQFNQYGIRSVHNFKIIKSISEGAYGVVYKARDMHTDEIVALKYVKIDPVKLPEVGFPISGIREIRALSRFTHPRIIRLREVVANTAGTKFYLVLDYADYDLNQLLTRIRPKFSLSGIKSLVFQLLEAVQYLHLSSFTHRDIKSSNILISHLGHLYLADFGLAKEYFTKSGVPLTPNVVTIGYRAPELVFGAKEYTPAIDIWSVGCIMAEMILGRPLVDVKTEVDQLTRMTEIFGTPNSQNYGKGVSGLRILQRLNLKPQPHNNLRSIFPDFDEQGFDLLSRLLCYNPCQRITAEEALNHEWFKQQPRPEPPQLANFEYSSPLSCVSPHLSPYPPVAAKTVQVSQPRDKKNNERVCAKTENHSESVHQEHKRNPSPVHRQSHSEFNRERSYGYGNRGSSRERNGRNERGRSRERGRGRNKRSRESHKYDPVHDCDYRRHREPSCDRYQYDYLSNRYARRVEHKSDNRGRPVHASSHQSPIRRNTSPRYRSDRNDRNLNHDNRTQRRHSRHVSDRRYSDRPR